MEPKSKLILAGMLGALCLPASGQRLYNKTGDETAQKAVDAAKTLASDSIFTKELANMDTLAKLETESLFSVAAGGLRNTIDAFATGNWGQVRSACAAGPMPDTAKLTEYKSEALRIQALIDVATDHIKARRASSSTRAADAAVKLLANGADANAAAAELIKFLASKSKNAGADAAAASALAGKIITQATSAATAIQTNQKAVDDVKKQLAALESSLDDLEIRRLQVEADHNRDMAGALEREKKDLSTIGDMSADCLALLTNMGGSDSDKVVKTLRTFAGREGAKEDPDKLDLAVQALFDAAAISARAKMPSQLRTLRLGQAEQRYAIRKSQAEARAYEIAVNSGVTRLSLYYKGGIKPESIAQIVYTAATVAIPPVIAAK